MRINERVLEITPSPTRRIDEIRAEMAARGRRIYMLSTGQPSIPPPREVRMWLAEELGKEGMGLYGYTSSQGTPRLRRAIAEELRRLGGLDLDPDKNVLVTAGGQEAMFVTLASIIGEGDEVIILDPTYFGYVPLIRYLGGRPVPVAVRLEDGWQPSATALEEAVTPRTRALVVVSPDNPTGRVISREAARGIIDFAHDHGIWLIVDEAYKTLIYEGEHTWFWRELPDQTVGINTFSKDPGIPGWRLGYIYGPERLVRAAKLLSEKVVYCPPSVAQALVARYLEEGLRDRFMEEVRRRYAEKRDALIAALRRYLPGVRFSKPLGSMFIFADFASYLSGPAEEFAERLLRDKGVATVPGTFFGEAGKTFLRLSFVTEDEDGLAEAVRLIGEAVG